MYTTISTEANGKFSGMVCGEDDSTLYRSPGYVTQAMALADAKCWAAFHGEDAMDIIKDTQTFMTHTNGTGTPRIVGPDHMRRVIKMAVSNGVEVSVRTGTKGRKYIVTHIGGSAYGTYFYMT